MRQQWHCWEREVQRREGRVEQRRRRVEWDGRRKEQRSRRRGGSVGWWLLGRRLQLGEEAEARRCGLERNGCAQRAVQCRVGGERGACGAGQRWLGWDGMREGRVSGQACECPIHVHTVCDRSSSVGNVDGGRKSWCGSGNISLVCSVCLSVAVCTVLKPLFLGVE